MIKLTLLHPLQSIPVRSWTFFEDEVVIRIGRSTDNHVVLYSAVVSRHHVEIRWTGQNWEVVNLGTNGTYLDGKPIIQTLVEDGLIIHLARSGPKIQINLGEKALKPETSRVQVQPIESHLNHDSTAKIQMSLLPVTPPISVKSSKEEDELTEIDAGRGSRHSISPVKPMETQRSVSSD